MRLIDADEFMNKILWSKRINSECPLEENALNTYDNGQEETFELIIKMLEEQPTAYDYDKVVDELEKASKDVSRGYLGKDNNKYHKHYKAVKLSRAIEIVKQGDVREDVSK